MIKHLLWIRAQAADRQAIAWYLALSPQRGDSPPHKPHARRHVMALGPRWLIREESLPVQASCPPRYGPRPSRLVQGDAPARGHPYPYRLMPLTNLWLSDLLARTGAEGPPFHNAAELLHLPSKAASAERDHCCRGSNVGAPAFHAKLGRVLVGWASHEARRCKRPD